MAAENGFARNLAGFWLHPKRILPQVHFSTRLLMRIKEDSIWRNNCTVRSRKTPRQTASLFLDERGAPQDLRFFLEASAALSEIFNEHRYVDLARDLNQSLIFDPQILGHVQEDMERSGGTIEPSPLPM
jgi:hypothetical protein